MNITHSYLACFTAWISLSLDVGSSNIHDSLTDDRVDETVISSPTSTSLVVSPSLRSVADNTYVMWKKEKISCIMFLQILCLSKLEYIYIYIYILHLKIININKLNTLMENVRNIFSKYTMNPHQIQICPVWLWLHDALPLQTTHRLYTAHNGIKMSG
jgi:hypothetical protein